MVRRWWVGVAWLATWGGTLGADPHFEEGNAVVAQFERLRSALNALDVDGVVAALAEEAVVWTTPDGRVEGAEAIRASLAKRFAGRPKNAYRATPSRVLLTREATWLVVAWEWNGEKGTLIARRSGGSRRFDRLDLEGGTLNRPEGDFDPRLVVAHLSEAVAMMEQAATAFREGDLVTLERLLRPDFAFYDRDGRLYEAPESFIVAALTPIPKGVEKEKMTLYLSWSTNRAVAFQEVEGRRISLLLMRSGGRWQVARASLSTPLETLVVSPRGRLATTWAALRDESDR